MATTCPAVGGRHPEPPEEPVPDHEFSGGPQCRRLPHYAPALPRSVLHGTAEVSLPCLPPLHPLPVPAADVMSRSQRSRQRAGPRTEPDGLTRAAGLPEDPPGAGRKSGRKPVHSWPGGCPPRCRVTRLSWLPVEESAGGCRAGGDIPVCPPILGSPGMQGSSPGAEKAATDCGEPPPLCLQGEGGQGL